VAEIYLPPRIPHEQVTQCKRCVFREICLGVPSRFVKTALIQDIKPVSDSIHVDAILGFVR